MLYKILKQFTFIFSQYSNKTYFNNYKFYFINKKIISNITHVYLLVENTNLLECLVPESGKNVTLL